MTRPCMQESATEADGACDELDLALVNALQINPRAPWSLLGQVLAVDPVTVARRWERLVASGTAWVTCYADVGDAFSGLVEIACRPDLVGQVADCLTADPHAVTVVHTTGDGLIVPVVTADFFDFSRYVLDRINRIPGVLSTRSHPFARSYAEGSHWRLDGLNREQQLMLAPPRAAQQEANSKVIHTDERPIALALAEDGRLPLTELAARTGVSINTARRRLQRLLDAGRIVLRCELARFCSGWPVTVLFWAKVPADEADSLARRIAGLRMVRRCATTASGPSNLVFTAWLRSVEEVQQLETFLARELPTVTVVDRSLILRPVKLVGSLLDPAGRRTGTVPMDIRRDPIPIG